MTANITYRQATQTPPGATTTKNAPLTNAELDGNIASIVTELGTKQATLVSNSNIKTVGGVSLLGSGDVTIQAPLVSGTNIKTVGGVSLVGTGDVSSPVFSGNLGFSGTTNRITGDFSAGALINRVSFQTSTTNGVTVIDLLPNGTGTSSSFLALNAADPTNSAGASVSISSTEMRLEAVKYGTGSYLPISFYSGGAMRVLIDTSGSVTFGSPSNPSVYIPYTASQVNYAQIAGSISGQAVSLLAKGTDTNVPLNIGSKGTGQIGFYTGSSANAHFVVADAVNTTRWISVSGSNGGNPTIGASGGSLAVTSPMLNSASQFMTKVTMAANNIDLSLGNIYSKTIAGNTTLTVSNIPATGTVVGFILDVTNGGSAVITWWSGVKWANATVPTLTAAGRDLLGFITHDGGTTWNGYAIARGVA
jgi:hypothetical protein